MTVNIVVVGSIALDTVSTPKGKRDRVLGGSAVYFSTVVSYFTRVGLVGVCGRDFGNENIQFLKDHSVDLEGFEQVDGLTFNWNGSYSDDFGDATTHSTCLNVFQSFDPKLPASYASTPYLFLANIHPALQLKVIERVKAPKLVALDTMNFWIEGALPDLKKALPRVDVLFLNRQEAYMLSGTKKLVSAYKKLLEMGPKRVVIKLGELGAMTATQSETFFVPAFPCPNLSDPTGAGDSFAGGFMGYLAQTGETSEIGFRRAMLYGTVMGSFTVEQFGLDSYNTLDRTAINNRYNKVLEMIQVS